MLLVDREQFCYTGGMATYGELELIEDPYARAVAVREYMERAKVALEQTRRLRDRTILELLETTQESRADVCLLTGVGMSHLRSLLMARKVL